MNARHVGKSLRWGYVAAAMFMSLLVAAAIHSPTVGALSVPDLAEVNLPINGTALDKVVSPLTEQTNRLLPVDITATPSTLGTQVNLPLLGSNSNQTPLINTSVDVPIIPQAVNAVSDTLGRSLDNTPSQSGTPTPVTFRTSPLQGVPQATPFPDTTADTAVQLSEATTVSSPANRGVTTNRQVSSATEAPMLYSPIIFGMANFLGHGVPGGVQTLMNISRDHPITITSIIFSLAIFMMTIAALFGAVYVIDHTSVIRFGNGRIAQFAQTHDLAQITSVIIVASGVILVTAFLVLKPF